MKLDLHLHSTVSDGTDTPQAILALVREAGLGLFSLTDHDAVKGCEQILRLRGPKDPAFLTLEAIRGANACVRPAAGHFLTMRLRLERMAFCGQTRTQR